MQTGSNKIWGVVEAKITPKHRVLALTASATIAAEKYDVDISVDNKNSRTELDSHSNMVVAG